MFNVITLIIAFFVGVLIRIIIDAHIKRTDAFKDEMRKEANRISDFNHQY